jgi:hypothetical protein
VRVTVSDQESSRLSVPPGAMMPTVKYLLALILMSSFATSSA